MQDFAMHLRITHDAAPHFRPAGLELWLDEGKNPSSIAQDPAGGRKYVMETDERDVDGHQIDRLGQYLEIPHVRAIEHDDPRILSKPRDKLTVADVDRVHPVSAVLK
jgi:hypothetical protein